MDTLWSDVSEWQVPVDDSYPYQVLAIRSNDGTYRDRHFQANYTWACRALDSGRLACLIIYLVYRQDWEADLATLQSVVGALHPRTAVMLDVESWSGQITGDNSTAIDSLYWRVANWVGDPRRVIGYGNTGDLNALWPARPANTRLIIAGYGTNPDYPGKFGHQFTDGATTDALIVPPFGRADVNSADGYDTAAFCAALGIDTPSTTRKDHPMTYRLDPTQTPTGAGPDAQPDGSWPAVEDTVTTPGPVGGWSGRTLQHLTFGFRGGFVQEAWSAPSGKHYVPRYDPTTKQGGLFVTQFTTQNWELPTGDTALVVRYATRARGSVTAETEH